MFALSNSRNAFYVVHNAIIMRVGLHSIGIGTNLTNDVGVQPMNIVMKMTEALPEDGEWTPVVKLSDEPGKHTGDAEMIALAKSLLRVN